MKPLAVRHKYVYHGSIPLKQKTEGNHVAVAKTKNTIELNGKRYDALTGTILSATDGPTEKIAVSVKHHVKKPGAPAHHVAPAISPRHTAAATASPSAPATPKASKQVMDIRRPAPSHIKHRRPEPSKTLMRTVVKKPTASLKSSLKSQDRTDVLAKTPAHLLVPKASIHHIDETRLKRAEQVAKNQLVSRFGTVEKPFVQHVTKAAEQVKQDVDAVIASVSTEISNIRPVYAATADAATRPSMDVFEQALARANSHKETYIDPKKARKAAKRSHHSAAKRFSRNGALALSVLLIAGFIAYQNTANMTMRVASSKAGFHASMPGFKPSGFAIGKFQYGLGYVAVNYHSNSDNRSFSVIQKSSSWNSESLLNEYVSNAAGSSYQTLEASGRTIYTYGQNNATWVDHGVWFNVTSNGSLSNQQLVNLATSM